MAKKEKTEKEEVGKCGECKSGGKWWQTPRKQSSVKYVFADSIVIEYNGVWSTEDVVSRTMCN